MKKLFIGIIALAATVAVGADVTQTATYTTKRPPRTKDKFYKKTADALYALVNTDVPAIVSNINGDKAVTGSLTVTSNATVTLKTTLNGETECNEDVDVNLNATDEEIAITQTAVAGPGSAGLIVIDDDRTGATVDAENEATITIDAEGTYAIGVIDGSISVGDGEIVLDGKYATVGPDASTALMIQTEDVTAPNDTLSTNTFAVAFGAAPVVTATYTEDPGDVRPIYVVSVTPSNVVFGITADKNYAYTAVGQRP